MPDLAISFESWTDGVSLSFDIQRWYVDGTSLEGGLVRFAGEYRGEPDGHFMAMVVAAALAWHVPPGVGLVLDIRQVTYTGGDLFTYWRTALAPYELDKATYPVAYCCSDRNEAALLALLADEGDPEPARWLFREPQAAIAAITASVRD